MKASRVPSLKALAARVEAGEHLAVLIRDFLDGFYERPRVEAIEEEPALLGEVVRDGGRADAFLAAVAEHLARQHQFPVPAWTRLPPRYLEQPWFGLSTHAGRMLLLADSPAAFRVRNIFVSDDALSRA